MTLSSYPRCILCFHANYQPSAHISESAGNIADTVTETAGMWCHAKTRLELSTVYVEKIL
jgi:hypothetical protein